MWINFVLFCFLMDLSYKDSNSCIRKNIYIPTGAWIWSEEVWISVFSLFCPQWLETSNHHQRLTLFLHEDGGWYPSPKVVMRVTCEEACESVLKTAKHSAKVTVIIGLLLIWDWLPTSKTPNIEKTHHSGWVLSTDYSKQSEYL